MYLDGHNRARRSTERKISKQARAMVEDGNLAGDARRAIVLASDAWHAGVIGIVASRLVERYQRPTVLIALSNGEGQGSARSIEHFNLADALCVCGEHLISYGGHAMAAGLRIDAARVDAFTEAFVAHANQTLTGEDLIPKLRLDAEVTLDALTIPTTEAIVGLGPFGLGNPKPTLSTAWVELAAEPRCVGSNGEHL
ncbi:MAG: single-stranded-DNA-specific exonuclease RecJ, partial [Planctomycetes bacterium]|nr:single-stranded-DNA-specific exonuclease RecJ [Planctomycetota bacterium]